MVPCVNPADQAGEPRRTRVVCTTNRTARLGECQYGVGIAQSAVMLDSYQPFEETHDEQHPSNDCDLGLKIVKIFWQNSPPESVLTMPIVKLLLSEC